VCCSYSDLWSVQLSETVVVICSYVLFKRSVNPITNPNLVSSHTYHVTMNMDFIGINCGCVDWIQLAFDVVQ
jgi:hypothetical protein